MCTRKITDYVSETKGNAAYGDADGVIGSFDVVLRTNLNGRQPQWVGSLIKDSGPPIDFINVFINCERTTRDPTQTAATSRSTTATAICVFVRTITDLECMATA